MNLLDFSKNCSILIQGPFNEDCLSYIGNYKNEIILSTWKETLPQGLDLLNRIKVISAEQPDLKIDVIYSIEEVSE